MATVIGTKFMAAWDRTADEMLAKLGCHDGADSETISHFQDSIEVMVMQITRKADRKSLVRYIRYDGTVLRPGALT